MIPSNALDKFLFSKLMSMSSEQRELARAFMGAFGAYSSACDLYSGAGYRQPVPTLALPVGKIGATRSPLFRVVCEQPCDRVTVSLARTILGSSTQEQPAQMWIEVFSGPECAEESLGLTVVAPPTFLDAGEVVTFTTSKLFDAIVIGGTTSDLVPGQKPQSVDLRIYADRIGACCAPHYGGFSGPAQQPPK